MVAAVDIAVFEAALGEGGAAEFTGADHQGVFEQAPHLQVLQQGGDRLVDVPRLAAQVLRKYGMVVPAPVEQLHEPNVPLGHATRQQAIAREGAGFVDLGAVHVQDGLLLLGDVGQFRNRLLHAKGHFVLAQRCLNFRVAGDALLVVVDLRDHVEHFSPHRAAHARRVGQKQHRVAHRLKRHALVFGRQKTRTPKPRVKGLNVDASRPEGAGQDHELRQILVECAQSVAEPRTHGGLAGHLGAGAEEGLARVVVDRGGGRRFDHAELVGHLRHVRQQFTHHQTAATLRRELEDRGADVLRLASRHGGDALVFMDFRRQRLAVPLFQVGFVVVQVQLARRPGHEQEDDALGLGRMVKARGTVFRHHPGRDHEAAGRRGAEAHRRAGQKLTPVLEFAESFEQVVHRRTLVISRFIRAWATSVQAAIWICFCLSSFSRPAVSFCAASASLA